jgi:hypothetical protein
MRQALQGQSSRRLHRPADRVFHHVEANLLELVLVQRPAPEAVAEDVSPASIFEVEPLGVVAVEDLHAVGEMLARRIEHQVIVVRHQAEGLTRPLGAVDRKGQQAEKVPAVIVVVVDRHLRDPAGGDVKKPVREEGARHPRHRRNLRGELSVPRPKTAVCGREVTVSTRRPCPGERVPAMSLASMSGTVPGV